MVITNFKSTALIILLLVTLQSKAQEPYIKLDFHFAFHPGLTIELQQDGDIHKLNVYQRPMHFRLKGQWPKGSFNYARSKESSMLSGIDELAKFDKPSFLFSKNLTDDEVSQLREKFKTLNALSKDDSLMGSDPIYDGYYVEYQSLNDAVDVKWFLPSGKGELGVSLIDILEFAEKTINNLVLDQAVDGVFRGLKPEYYPFRIVSISPVYVKILDTPCCTCNEKNNKLFDSLGDKRDIIYVDITNYIGKDTDCLVKILKKKYDNVAWVVDGRNDHKYYKIMGKD